MSGGYCTITLHYCTRPRPVAAHLRDISRLPETFLERPVTEFLFEDEVWRGRGRGRLVSEDMKAPTTEQFGPHAPGPAPYRSPRRPL